MAAVSSGSIEVVQLLLAYGAVDGMSRADKVIYSCAYVG
jgi:hypothetical protein